MKKLLLIILLIVGCEEPTGFGNGEDYSFKLNVKDSSGVPIPNAEFKVRYIPLWGSEANLGRMMPVSNITVAIPQTSSNTLIIYNLANEVVDTVFHGTLEGGTYYEFAYACCSGDTSYKAGVKVFKYVLRSTATTSDQLLFTDTKYMVMINGAIDLDQLSSAGFIDENGYFESSERLWFPTLYTLPDIGGRDERGMDTGDFSLNELVSDSVEIRIEIDGSIYVHKHHLINGLNEIDMVITEPLSRFYTDPSAFQTPIRTSDINFMLTIPKSNTQLIPEESSSFSMSQNYPNPFN